VVPKASQKFKAGPGNFYSQDLLLNHKNAQANITMRDRSGQAEVHADWEDHIFILEGECTLMLGGTVENPKSTGPGETRGDNARGGKSFAVHAGDYIYVPVNTPHQMILAAGKSVLVEKPLTISAAESAELIDLAEANGRFLMEAVWMRVHPLIRKAAEVAASGELGAVRHVSAGFGFVLDGPETHRLLDPAQAGGTILDMGVYPVHAVNLFLGEPAEVSGYGSWRRTGVEGHAAALLSYPATEMRPTATASVISTFEVALPGALEVYCTAGRIMIEEFFIRPERMTIHRDGAEPEELVAQWPGGGYTFEAQEVMRCLRAGEQQSPLVPWRDTLAVAWVLDEWRAALGDPPEVQP